MNNSYNIIAEALEHDIHYASSDLLAEAQMNAALQKGFPRDGFLAKCDQYFKRRYRKDLAAARIADVQGNKELLQISLSRPGLYDQLPEGLFFQSATGNNSIADTRGFYKENKKIETRARLFFEPLDHEFFLQRLQREIAEYQMLAGFGSGIMDTWFIEFWNLPENLSHRFVLPLVNLLPHAAAIAGNMKVIEECLSSLLKESVEIKEATSLPIHASNDIELQLGKNQLGINMHCGFECVDNDLLFEIIIGPLISSSICDFMPGGDAALALDTAIGFFMPASVQIITTVLVADAQQHMELTDSNQPILGYSSAL